MASRSSSRYRWIIACSRWLSMILVAVLPRAAVLADTTAALLSADASLEHLRHVMDQYHHRLPVYDDVSSAGNHFHAWAKIPNGFAAVRISGSSTELPHGGATAIRAEFDNTTGLNYGGFYFLNGVLPPGARAPQPNFGEVPNAGIDLTGATNLSFWARGAVGGEMVEFFMGGVGRDPMNGRPIAPFPSSTQVVKRAVTLTSSWRRYTLDLSGRDLSYVLGGFGWVASARLNPRGAVFFIDDIEYELASAALEARLHQPRLLASFVTRPVQSLPPPVGDFDFVFRNGATTYDNALALLAFLADGSADSLRRARLIGDALVYAKDHDRTYDGDRLRDVYAAGDLALPPGWTPNGRPGTVPIPGYFDEASQTFVEIEQGGISTGNNAWAMIALLALFQHTGDLRYRRAAEDLGHFIQDLKQTMGTYRGFVGGWDEPEEPHPRRRPWASTEHNLDVYAAFGTMFDLTHAAQWRTDALHALEFVEAMWDEGSGCNLTGTVDPETRNAAAGQLPVDVQAWEVLAVPDAAARHARLLACAEAHHRTTHLGFTGFDFNDDRDGVWFEGTGHMAVAYAHSGHSPEAEALRAQLRSAQAELPFGDTRGIAAASREGLTTGFDFLFFRRLHVAATAWNVFAQLQVDPFYSSRAAEDPCVPSPTRLCLLGNRFAVEVHWRNQHAWGTEGSGKTLPGTDKTGYFWFFRPTNLELLVKILDGRPINGRFWVFWGALSDVEYTIDVRDTVSGTHRTYHNDPGDICGRADLGTIPGSGPPLLPPSSDPTSSDSVASTPVGPVTGGCVADSLALCLADRRFRFTVHWRNQHAGGVEGEGRAIPFTDQAGLFWFFNQDNVELAVKVLDGRPVNDHFWVFYGALSDVEYWIEVTDTAVPRSKTYHNDPGNICGDADTSAFAGG